VAVNWSSLAGGLLSTRGQDVQAFSFFPECALERSMPNLPVRAAPEKSSEWVG